MKLDYVKKSLVVLALNFCLTGCIHIGTPESEPIQRYTLTAPSSLPIHASDTGKVVVVDSGAALPGMRGTGMLYQQKDFQLQEYLLHRWVAPPVSMIAPIIATELSYSGAFKAVVSAPNDAGMPNYQVSVILQRLQQNFVAEHSKEVLDIQLILINMKANQVMASKTFTKEIDAAPNAPGGVLAANQALAELMPDMIQFIVQTLH